MTPSIILEKGFLSLIESSDKINIFNKIKF